MNKLAWKRRIVTLSMVLIPTFLLLDYSHSQAGTMWSVRVNPELEKNSFGIYGLWKSPRNHSQLFFGIFDDQLVAEKALLAIKKLDPDAVVTEIPANTVPSFIPVVKRISLTDLGYDTPLYIRGVHGWASVHIPWSKTALSQGLKATLNIQYPTGIFQKPSTLTVTVENVPVKVLSLDQPATSSITFPIEIPDGIDIGDFLDISFTTAITITGDICTDEQTGNAWVLVNPSSFFEIAFLPDLQDAFDTLRIPASQFNVIFLNEPSLDALAGLVNLSALVGAIHAYSHKRVLLLGEEYSITQPNIIVKSEGQGGRVVGRDLVSSPQGLLDLARMSTRMPAIFKSWKSGKAWQGSREKEFAVTFADLGIIPPRLKGAGELQFSIPFSTASFGGFPAKLIATILYSHSPVTKNERAFLKARLNGVLVGSKLLTGSASFESFSFNLPLSLLQTRNTLEISFAYFTNRGECKGSFPELEVSVLPDSYFSVIGHSHGPVNTFDWFPGLLEGNGTMVVGELNPPIIDLAIGLSEKLGKIRRAPFYVNVVGMDQFQPDDLRAPFVIGIVKASQSKVFKAPVDISEKFLIQNPQTGQVFVEVETTDKVAVWEVFNTSGNTPVGLLALSDALVDKNVAEILLKDLKIVGSANVSIWTTRYPTIDREALLRYGWQSFEVGDKMRIIVPTKKGFSYYWVRYRIVFFVLMALAVFVFLWYVYRKLT